MRRRLLLALWNFLYRRLKGREWLVIPLIILYWLSPIDLMPFLPIDDLLVTLLGSLFLLFNRQRRRSDDRRGKKRKESDDIIDIEGKVIK